jgi:predicted nucleic acid-binding protein
MTTLPSRLGLDTGFFKRLDSGGQRAETAWAQIVGGGTTGIISCVTIFELQKLGLRGVIEKQAVESLTEELHHVCQIIWLTENSLIRRAARISHGNNIAMANALILTSLMEADAEHIYTTDTDFERYEAGPADIVLLR